MIEYFSKVSNLMVSQKVKKTTFLRECLVFRLRSDNVARLPLQARLPAK